MPSFPFFHGGPSGSYGYRLAEMKRVLYFLANLLGGVVLDLLLDPTRPLAPVFVLLALAVVCAVLPRFLPR